MKCWRCVLGLLLVPSALRAEFPDIVDLLNITPDNGIIYLGERRDIGTGRGMVLGDINGDGLPDVILSAPVSGQTLNPGRVYVIFGGSPAFTSGFIDLVALAPPDGFVIDAVGDSGLHGAVLGTADFNGDGMDDLVIGAAVAAPPGGLRNGQVYVVFGHPNIGASGSFDVTSLDGHNGFLINGRDVLDGLGSPFGRPGVGVEILDYDADGFADFVVRAPGADAPGRPAVGQIYLIFGGSGLGASGELDLDDLDGTNGITIDGTQFSGDVGQPASVGDLDGDGIDDLAVGRTSSDAIGRPQAGLTYVLFGGTPADPTGHINQEDIPSIGGLVVYGPFADARAGLPARVGEMDGDGRTDLLIGSSQGTWIVRGGPHLERNGIFDLADIDGTNGFRTPGQGGPTGDLDGDDIDDLVVFEDALATVGGRMWAGRAYIMYGHPGIGESGEIMPPFDSSDPNIFEIWGARAFDMMSVFFGIPDLNGDGLAELNLTAELVRPDGSTGGGGYILYGQRRFALGDFDRDRDVDLSDFLSFTMCYNGPARPPAGSCPEGVRADFDGDSDVDLADYAVFGQNYTGAR